MDKLNVVDAKNMLIYVADKIISSKELLTEIDSKIGDGDHGIGMEVGMKKLKEKLSDKEFNGVYQVFEVAGKAMVMSMGGASGVIFGSLFREGGKTDVVKDSINVKEFAAMERKSLDAIKARGKANLGDKTMVDALEPAVVAMEEYNGNDFLELFEVAEKAAKDGVEKTKDYIANFGRAKSLMERAIGYQDAGATSVWLIFEGMREYVKNN